MTAPRAGKGGKVPTIAIAIGVLSGAVVLLVIALVPFPLRLTHRARMEMALDRVARAVDRAQKTGRISLDALSGGLVSPDALNSAIAEKVFVRAYDLRRPDIERLLGVRTSGEDSMVLLDFWGRPIIFQIPTCYPDGLEYNTATGPATIRPLEESIWASKANWPFAGFEGIADG